MHVTVCYNSKAGHSLCECHLLGSGCLVYAEDLGLNEYDYVSVQWKKIVVLYFMAFVSHQFLCHLVGSQLCGLIVVPCMSPVQPNASP